MSRLLKAAAADAAIRPFPKAGAALPSAAPFSADPMAALLARIAELEAELGRASAALPAKLDAAREEGRLAGLKERDQQSAKRLQHLERVGAEAVSAWTEQLAGSHGLAIEISRAVLGRMIANPDWRSELVREAIGRRLAELGARSLLSLRVSGEDFADGELDALAADPKLKIVIDPKLKSGDCVIDCAMGQIELGPAAQWRRVAMLLDELADSPC